MSTNPLTASDEEFLKDFTPPPADEGDKNEPTPEEEKGHNEGDAAEEEDEDDTSDKDAGNSEKSDDDDKTAKDDDAGDKTDNGDKSDDDEDPDKSSPEDKEKTKDSKESVKDEPEAKSQANSENKKEEKSEKTEEKPGTERVFQVPTSFKANGKTIELKNEQEALALMQMGANYTKKLQELQPHRKMLMMLENNGLLNEGKLSFLIDLEKKNPEAIKKLIKDAGIDPLEIDTSVDSAYRPGDHSVTDQEEQFRTVISDIATDEAGKETVLKIQSWDQTSKDAVWAQPEIMRVIHEQRENGVYDIITTEMERRKTLGTIPQRITELNRTRKNPRKLLWPPEQPNLRRLLRIVIKQLLLPRPEVVEVENLRSRIPLL
jgi:hypothetical protein